MTHEEVAPLIARLAVPSILTMLVTNIYNLVDTAFVGQLGTSASGAVGVVFAFMSIIQALGFMFGQGAGSILGGFLRAFHDSRVVLPPQIFPRAAGDRQRNAMNVLFLQFDSC